MWQKQVLDLILNGFYMRLTKEGWEKVSLKKKKIHTTPPPPCYPHHADLWSVVASKGKGCRPSLLLWIPSVPSTLPPLVSMCVQMPFFCISSTFSSVLSALFTSIYNHYTTSYTVKCFSCLKFVLCVVVIVYLCFPSPQFVYSHVHSHHIGSHEPSYTILISTKDQILVILVFM